MTKNALFFWTCMGQAKTSDDKSMNYIEKALFVDIQDARLSGGAIEPLVVCPEPSGYRDCMSLYSI